MAQSHSSSSKENQSCGNRSAGFQTSWIFRLRSLSQKNQQYTESDYETIFFSTQMVQAQGRSKSSHCLAQVLSRIQESQPSASLQLKIVELEIRNPRRLVCDRIFTIVHGPEINKLITDLHDGTREVVVSANRGHTRRLRDGFRLLRIYQCFCGT